MKARVPTGFAVIFFETDPAYLKPTEPNQFDEMQKTWFSRVGPNEQASILEGRPASVINVADSETLCEFNKQNFHPTDAMLKSLAKTLLPSIQEYFENKDNMAEFKKEQAEKEE